MEDNNEHDPPSDDDMEEEHQVEDMLPPTAGGKRKSRRKTNFLYRYDSLRGSDMDDYSAMADYIKTMTTCLSALLIYHQVVSMQLLMAMMTRMDLRMMLLLHHNWTILHRAIAWLTCAIYLFILDVEDLLFYDPGTRPRPADIFGPKHHTTIASLSDIEADDWTGFSKARLALLMLHWRIPATFRWEQNGTKFTGEEALLYFLTFLKKGETFTEMWRRFGGDPRRFTYAVRLVSDHLWTTFYNKICGDSMQFWVPWVDRFRLAIWRKLVSGETIEYAVTGIDAEGAPIINEVARHIVVIEPEDFRIFGFIDDVAIKTCRPGEDARRRYDFDLGDLQRAFYSSYFKGHGLKGQVVFLPNGMVGNLYLTSMRHNDNGILNMSGLSLELHRLLENNLLGPNHERPALYGDGIFARLSTIIPRFSNHNITDHQRRMNLRMSSQRVFIEHFFAIHHNTFAGIHNFKRLKLFRRGEHVTKLIFSSFLTWNCYQSFHGSFRGYPANEFPEYAAIRPPTIQQYLPLDEVLEPGPDLFEGLDGLLNIH